MANCVDSSDTEIEDQLDGQLVTAQDLCEAECLTAGGSGQSCGAANGVLLPATVATKRCKNSTCLESRIEWEDGILVCTTCGQVHPKESGHLRNDPNQEYSFNCHSDQTKSYTHGCGGRRYNGGPFSTAKKFNTLVLDNLVSSLKLGRHVRDVSIEMYKTLISDAPFRHSAMATKRVLAAICLYITLVKEGQVVTIGHICNAVNCTIAEFNKAFNNVIKVYPDYRPDQMTIESLVPVVLSEANINADERKVLEEKVLKILELERECWLIEGRTPVYIIYAAAFLAWKSLDSYNRRKVKLADWCGRLGIAYKHTTRERVTELTKAIVKLAQQPKEVRRHLVINSANISVVLDDVLQYKSSLVFDLNQQMKRRLQANGMHTDAADDDNPDSKASDWIHVFKSKSRDKRRLTATVTTDETHDIKSDEEINDEEIDKYLRSDREIKMIKKLKRYAPNEDQDVVKT